MEDEARSGGRNEARMSRGERVLCLPDGAPITRDRVIKAIRGAQRVAGVPHAGVHVLRHTFCSHLPMRGTPARAIQELAGHSDLSTTQRYMHLSHERPKTRFGRWNRRPFCPSVATWWQHGGNGERGVSEV
jgi:site-specific recombinase XerD